MAVEQIEIDGGCVETLKELLRPGLRAVFVGMNPTPLSVARGHYYQGRLGQRLWRRLQTYGLATELPVRREDNAAFAQGFGFADLVRRPTTNSKALRRTELDQGARDLARRLKEAAPDRPPLVFVFNSRLTRSAALTLESDGYRILRLPAPFASGETEQRVMAELRVALYSGTG